eukprot:gene5784-7281_t
MSAVHTPQILAETISVTRDEETPSISSRDCSLAKKRLFASPCAVTQIDTSQSHQPNQQIRGTFVQMHDIMVQWTDDDIFA